MTKTTNKLITPIINNKYEFINKYKIFNTYKYTPKYIKNKLDEYVIGHEKTKKIISLSIYNHYKIINEIICNKKKIYFQKPNILLIGPSGSGKTLIAKTISKIINIPMVITDATTLTQAGYVGEDVENILLRLLQKCNYDIKKTQYGIIFIDEIDKISKTKNNLSITRDVSGEGVQQSLLKILEGTISSVPIHGGRKHPSDNFIQINTENILFICSGTFNGINKIIKKKNNNKKENNIGFINNLIKKKNNKNYKNIEPKDLIKFGFIPEFIGRFPIITKIKKLKKKEFKLILTKPKNSIIEYYKLIFKLDNCKIKFDSYSLNWIADKAVKEKIGARGLKNIIENILYKTMYNISNNKKKIKIKINKEFIKNINKK